MRTIMPSGLLLNKRNAIISGFIFHVLAAIFSIGYHQCDELFQVFEFAGYKLGINTAQDLPWEFASHMRSGIQPMIVFGFTHFFNLLSITNPFTIALFLRLFQSLLSFFAIVQLLNFFEKEFTTEKMKIYLWWFGLLFWCLPYFHARLSSENFSATLFLLGAVLTMNAIKNHISFPKLIAAGFLLGIAFVCRFQISFMIAGFFAWLLFIAKIQKQYWIALFSGLIFAFGFGLIADKWFYDEWTLTGWNYLNVNFFQGKASQFGNEPFYFYFSESVLQLLPPFGLFFVLIIIYFWFKFPKHLITWITLPFILLHFFTGHKELRFLFPVINFLPVITLLFFQSIESGSILLIKIIRNKVIIYVFIIINFGVLCFFSLKPASDRVQLLKKIYETSANDKWTLLYQKSDPCDKAGSLNYFKNKNVSSIQLNEVNNISELGSNVFYFSDSFNKDDTLRIKNQRFKKIYSNVPDWLSHFNFNNWLERSAFSLYKIDQ